MEPALLNQRCGRRELLSIGGGLAAFGLAGSAVAAGPRASAHGGRSCILVYLLGGPSHLDTFDLKPAAPLEVRGPFAPISTSVPGLHICEHLPRLAGMAERFALVRSVTQANSNHTPMIYYTLTGRHTSQPELDNDVRPPQRADFPHLGSIVAQVMPQKGALPGFVAIPEVAIRSSLEGEFKRTRSPLRGGGAGFLSTACDPLAVNGDPGTTGAVPALEPPPDMSGDRFERRASLLSLLDGSASGRAVRHYNEVREQALLLTGARSRANRDAFTLDAEPAAVRERYGTHRFGKALLLARRLTEAGVPLVAVHFNEMTMCDGWDTHSKNFEGLQQELLPMLDQGLSALIDDLEQRDRLDQTLVTCFGEFGRTPKINANAGRDHWGPCSSTLLAGGGIAGGRVLGASDRIAAYPISDPVDPVDIHATIYHCLGIDPQTTIHDRSGQPWHVSTGKVLTTLL
ncbi:MAG: DUF1501 domain-containing protein [Planctomycetaceae bacterium]|nr:DUF1501 domain-containing protein [Planctomycetaceae bacterium]